MKLKIRALPLHFTLEVKCFTYFMFYLTLSPAETKCFMLQYVGYSAYYCKLGHNPNRVTHKNVLSTIYC